MNDTTTCSRPNSATWEELDERIARTRTVDSIDLELTLRCTADLRRRVLALQADEREQLVLSLQNKATAATCVDKNGKTRRVILVAAPFVLGYTFQHAVLPQPALFREKTGTALSERWRQIWQQMIPGATVVPATSCVLLSEVADASPDQVHACLQEGVGFVQGGPKPRLRIGSKRVSPAGHRHTALGPVAATYLALAYAVLPDDGKSLDAQADASVLAQAAGLLQAVFAVRQEMPRVRVLPPSTFFDAVQSATAAHLRHFVEWGNEHDPDWTLDLMLPERATSVEALGTFSNAPRVGDDQAREASLMRWVWDRVWWTDKQLEKIRSEVDEPEGLRAFLRGHASPPDLRACVAGIRTGALH